MPAETKADVVMAGHMPFGERRRLRDTYGPAIDALLGCFKTWMPATSAGMTELGY